MSISAAKKLCQNTAVIVVGVSISSVASTQASGKYDVNSNGILACPGDVNMMIEYILNV